jgi:Icc-related predicted phosphoesterase
LKGFPYLTEIVSKLKNLKIHSFGHVHYLHGFELVDGKLFINAANDIKDFQLPAFYVDLKY